MAIARKIAYNVAASTVGKVLSTILALVGIGIITRYLGKEGFGNYATAVAFFSLFAALADLGIYSVATREISRPNADQKRIMGNVFTLRLASCFVVLALSPIIVFLLPYPEEVKIAILISAAAFIFASGYQVLNGIFQKNLAMDKVAISELIGKIVQVSVIYLAFRLDLGLLAVVSSILFSMMVNFTLVYLWSRKYLKFGLRFDFNYWRTFLRQSLPMGISILVTFIYFKTDTIMLSIMKTSADVGIYNAAYKIIENLAFFPGMIMGLILPIMAHRIFSDRDGFWDISNKVFKFFLMLIIPLVVGTVFLAGDIINVIGGAGFSESNIVLKILIFALAFIFFGNFTNAILLSANLQKKLMYALAFCAVFNVVLNILVIPKYSYIGTAATSVATEFLVFAITLYLVKKYVSFRPRLDGLGQFALGGLLMGLFLYFTPASSFLLRIVAGTAIYFIALWAVGGITVREVKSIFSRGGGSGNLTTNEK